MGNYLTRDEILAADDLQYQDVPVPEWGGTVLVRGLTGTDRDRFEEGMVRVRGGKKVGLRLANTRAKLLTMCLVDAEGETLFSPSDVSQLGEKSARAIERVFDVALRLSGLAPGDIEALAKNSPAAPNDGSGSG